MMFSIGLVVIGLLWLASVGALVYGHHLVKKEMKEHPGRFHKRWDGKIVRRGHDY